MTRDRFTVIEGGKGETREKPWSLQTKLEVTNLFRQSLRHQIDAIDASGIVSRRVLIAVATQVLEEEMIMMEPSP